jgi:predicted GIY-YIG superfamily endonuclease
VPAAASFSWLTPHFYCLRSRRSCSLTTAKRGGRSGVLRYLLNSLADPAQRYIGFTTDLKRRLKSHNEGASVHTRKYRPWKLTSYFAFDDERTARAFEYYLKSGSGRAFANKRLWPSPPE